jgi:hypothetical protein
MADNITHYINKSLTPKTDRKLRSVLADAYTFVRSAEANKAFSTVTLEELMGDQIKRNGESKLSNANRYNPYSYDPKKPPVLGTQPQEKTNLLGGSDTGRPTKLDYLLAIKNELTDAITSIKSLPPSDVADAREYTDGVEAGPPVEG